MTNETTASAIDWKEIAITATIVLVVGTVATVIGLYTHEAIKSVAAKKSSSKEKEEKKS